MGTPLTDNLKRLFNNEKPDKAFFVPMLKWCSAYEPNIELCQRINKNSGRLGPEPKGPPERRDDERHTAPREGIRARGHAPDRAFSHK